MVIILINLNLKEGPYPVLFERKKMKVLIVTGQLAKENLKKYARESTIDVEVIDLSFSVAALLTPSMIAIELKNRNIKGYDLILIPGRVQGDASIVEKALGIPTFKGPKESADLPVILNLLDKVKLSRTRAADELLKNSLKQKALKELKISEEKRELLLKCPRNILINNLAVGKDFPMRIMAEILHAPTLSDNEILERVEYYIKSGADIIDLGMIAGESRPIDVSRIVKVVKSSFDLPLSLDTFDIEEARAGVNAGVDMLLSVDGSNISEVAKFASNTFIVITPTNHCEAYLPKKAIKRVKILEDNIRKAVDLGIKNVVADLVLDPINIPGIIESLVAYYKFSKRNPKIPLLFGSGNVTELTDADSAGLNALLAGIASELNVSILLTTEGSDKTMGSVRELAIASKMMFLAKKRNSVPKDLGFDLLLLKDKQLRDIPYEKNIEANALIIEARKDDERRPDSKGYFRIFVDRRKGKIVAIHQHNQKPSTIIKGEKAEEICSTIIKMKLVSTLNHASYLGRELEKAETALKIGKTYLQDEEIFSYP